MIEFEKALEIVENHAINFGIEPISFEEASGRVLAESLFADRDMPPFNKSAMDGFACRRVDLAGPLEVIEVIRAGIAPEKTISQGNCSQIMTGAIIPPGADTVVRIEDCSILDTGPEGIKRVRFIASKTAPNICYQGEDMQKGSLLLNPGTLMETRHIPILAAIGQVFVHAYKIPEIGVLSTGTELVEPGEIPGKSQIRNTNAYQIMAQLMKMGIECDYYGIAPDDEEICRGMIAGAMNNCDILILSGGVSMGDFDFVPGILQSLGIKLEFRQVAIQPGKPTVFGAGKGKFVFGLPGNPVSSFFLLELLIRPFLYKCMGHQWNPPSFRLRLAEQISRRKSDRLGWLPVRIDTEGLVHPVDYHGSAHIFALREASGIISVPIGTTVVEEGAMVDVRPI